MNEPETQALEDGMKTLEENFIDWESDVFGFGYGSGEPHIIPTLRHFFSLVPEEGCYDYEILEKELTPVVAWLLINILCKADNLEYGTSPRGAWLTSKGVALREFMLSRGLSQLMEILNYDCSEYIHCGPDYCNCGEKGYEEGRKCHNPFWT